MRVKTADDFGVVTLTLSSSKCLETNTLPWENGLAMPFTPFHMGPGLLIKAILRSSFSLMIFGWSQILIDLEPLIAITTGWGRVHGWSHTYVGASIIALFAAWTGKPLLDWALPAFLNGRFMIRCSWVIAMVSGLIGTYSHVALDSIMHFDVEPFAPFSLSNPMIRVISVAALHKTCVLTGLLGAVLYGSVGLLFWLRGRSENPPE